MKQKIWEKRYRELRRKFDEVLLLGRELSNENNALRTQLALAQAPAIEDENDKADQSEGT